MLERLLPRFSNWIWNPMWRRGPTWYSSTWWPTDSLATLQQSLLHILAVAHSERLELAPLVRHFAAEHRGRYRRTLQRLAKRLEAGTGLEAALEQTPDALSDDMVLALRLGSQTGTLSSTYQEMIESDELQPGEGQWRLRNAASYWIVLSVFIVSILIFLVIFIAPMFVRIFAEFGKELPASFKFLMRTIDFLSRYAWLWLILAFFVAWLIWSSTSRRFFRRVVAFPFVRHVAQLRAAELLRLLALAVESGRPLPGTLSTLAKYHFDRHVRHKLLLARNEVEQGEDLWKSLSDAKLLTPQETVALAASPSNQVRAWTLRRMATSKQRWIRQKAAARFALLQPAVVLVFAALVLWICFAFFSILPTMIRELA